MASPAAAFDATVKKAQRIARARGCFMYVVREGGIYDTATDGQLSTYYLGARVVLTIGPDGEPE